MALDTLASEDTIGAHNPFASVLDFYAQMVHSFTTSWQSSLSLYGELGSIYKEMQTQHQSPLSYTTTQEQYHSFMASQKLRKAVLETSLEQLQLFKTKNGYIFPEQQRLENYIRTNLAFTFTFERPEYKIEQAKEENIFEGERMNILRFSPEDVEKQNAENMYLIAPISGHFPTLLRKTIQALIDEGYVVYLTDWKAPLEMKKGVSTSMDDYTGDIIASYETITSELGSGEVFDVLAVCQPGPITLSSLAIAESQTSTKPRSVTLMASPIDTSVNPTKVGEVGEAMSPATLRSAQLTSPKSGIQVYPGTYQISNFISANFRDHSRKYQSLAFSAAPLELEQEKMLQFYHEYFAVMDIPYDFFRETVTRVFQQREWATGKIRYQDELFDLKTLSTPLCIIEGEKDDICGIGETQAALHITGQKVSDTNYICVPGAGHYGVFAGKAFRHTVIPFIEQFQKQLS